MEALRKFIENYTRLSESDWEAISQAFERHEFRKNEMILTEGAVCRHFYFLEEGIIRFFMLNDGDEITKFFYHRAVLFHGKRQFPEPDSGTRKYSGAGKNSRLANHAPTSKRPADPSGVERFHPQIFARGAKPYRRIADGKQN